MYNLIRGTNPAPGAWTTVNGDELSIYDSELVAGDGVAGRVTDIADDGITIQASAVGYWLNELNPKAVKKCLRANGRLP